MPDELCRGTARECVLVDDGMGVEQSGCKK